MKNKPAKDSIFTLLARNYLLFTLAVLLFIVAVYCLWDMRIQNLYFTTNWDDVINDPAFASENYEKLLHYLIPGETCLSIFDGNGRRLYVSDQNMAPEITLGELECVPGYDSWFYVTNLDFLDDDNNLRHLVTQTFYDDTGKRNTVLLDESYHVLTGSLGDGRTAYTEREIAYMTNSIQEGCSFYRVEFTGSDGTKRIALLQDYWYSEASWEKYEKKYRYAQGIWLLLVPLCLVAAGGFVLRINRQVRHPLDRLNRVIDSYTEGNPVRAAINDGPREIRQLGESFDRLSARLAESEAEREKLDEGRQKLIADISHDLKTPITVIAGYADAICDGKIPPEEERHYLNVIRNKAETLTELINAFHEYTKVEHPDFMLDLDCVDICEWMRKYLSDVYDEIILSEFHLQVEIPEQIICCEIDSFHFRRVMDNLLSNSLRHNRQGTTLFFDVALCGQTVIIRIGDDGQGIPCEMAETIFEPFAMGDPSRSAGGSGLGLSIARRILEKQGGSIRLAIPPSAGRKTEFVLKLPAVTHLKNS